jgi:hypothetical protein
MAHFVEHVEMVLDVLDGRVIRELGQQQFDVVLGRADGCSSLRILLPGFPLPKRRPAAWP